MTENKDNSNKIFTLRKVYPPTINTEREAISAIEDFPLNYCKLNSRLKNEHKMMEQALKGDPFSVCYMDREKLSPDLQVLVDQDKYLDKYLLDTAELVNKNEQTIIMRNKNLFDIENEIRKHLNDLDKASYER